MKALYFLGFFAVGQGLFQTFLIGSGIKNNSKDQVYLGCILTFLSLSVLEYSLIWSNNISIAPHLIGFSSIAQFLFFPFIYFFFKASQEKQPQLRFIHFLLFLLVLFQFSSFLLLSGSEKMAQIGMAYSKDFSIGNLHVPLCILFCTQCIVYIFFIKKIKDRKQGILSIVLYRILLAYITIHLLHTTLIYFAPMSLRDIGVGILSTSIISIYVLSYYVYKRGQIIKEEKLPKYYHSKLEKTQASKNIIALNDFLKEENYFTNSDIRIGTIAKALDISNQHLSQSINQELGCSFREHLNGMRIEYAKSLIEKEKNQRVSLKEVAFDSGFNNKTSFANAFKKKDNMSPSQYLEWVRNNPPS